MTVVPSGDNGGSHDLNGHRTCARRSESGQEDGKKGWIRYRERLLIWLVGRIRQEVRVCDGGSFLLEEKEGGGSRSCADFPTWTG